ncbi:XRN1-like protein, partial [Mya arenaria]
PIIPSGSLIPDSSTGYQLFDRVVNTRQGFSVPFGLRGTIVGIHQAEVEINTVNSSNRGYRMFPSALLNLTHGERKNGAWPSTRVNMSAQQMQGQNQARQYRNVSSDFTNADAAAWQPSFNKNDQYQGQQRNQGYHYNREGNNSGQRGRQTNNLDYDRHNWRDYHQQRRQQYGQQLEVTTAVNVVARPTTWIMNVITGVITTSNGGSSMDNSLRF